MVTERGSALLNFWYEPKSIALVFEAFRVNRLSSNHVAILPRSAQSLELISSAVSPA
jgi:hypothetical protein